MFDQLQWNKYEAIVNKIGEMKVDDRKLFFSGKSMSIIVMHFHKELLRSSNPDADLKLWISNYSEFENKISDLVDKKLTVKYKGEEFFVVTESIANLLVGWCPRGI